MTVNKTYIGKASPRIRIINSNCYSSTNHQAKGIQKLKGLSLGPYCQNTRTTSLCFSFFRATLSGLDTFHLHLLLLFLCPASPNSVICLHKKKRFIYLWGRENACDVRKQLFCELVLFFPFVLRQLEPWSELLAKVPISSFYLTETSWGYRCTALHLASMWAKRDELRLLGFHSW